MKQLLLTLIIYFPLTAKIQAQKTSAAYFGSGCFWCVEAIFETVKGVKSADSGYSGGSTKMPTYEEVCTGLTGHAETVKVIYDPSIISYKDLLRVFFNSHDPSTLNKEKKTISNITTTLEPFVAFYKAESYHQDFEKRNPDNAYVRQVSIPRLKAFKKKSKEYLKNNHE